MTTTVYVAPTALGTGSQCRIYAADGRIASARNSLAAHPQLWREIGLMRHDGSIRCIEPGPWVAELQECLPLSAGMQLHVN